MPRAYVPYLSVSCGFDPDSLDMLLFPELSLCFFDSISPHEYYPGRVEDTVIDMYTELITEGTDELYEHSPFCVRGIYLIRSRILTDITDTESYALSFDASLRLRPNPSEINYDSNSMVTYT